MHWFCTRVNCWVLPGCQDSLSELAPLQLAPGHDRMQILRDNSDNYKILSFMLEKRIMIALQCAENRDVGLIDQ